MVKAYLQGICLCRCHTGHTRLFFQSSSPRAERSTLGQTGEFSDTWADFDSQAKEALVCLS